MDESRIENELPDRLADTVDHVRVGPAPVAAMLADARTARRRRTAVVSVAAAAVVMAVAGSTFLFGGAVGDVPVADGGSSGSTAPLPQGHRLVGVGPVGVTVPEGWGLNEAECGTPAQDTLIVDGGFQCLMDVTRKRGVESLEIVEGDAPPQLGEQYVESTVDGEQARIGEVICNPEPANPQGRMTVCRSAVHLPGPRIGFIATSSTQPESVARVEVEAMLAGIRMLPEGQVGVPSHRRVPLEVVVAQGDEVEWYVSRLAEFGLVADVPDGPPVSGQGRRLLTDVEPAPGTVLSEGEVVRLVSD